MTGPLTRRATSHLRAPPVLVVSLPAVEAASWTRSLRCAVAEDSELETETARCRIPLCVVRYSGGRVGVTIGFACDDALDDP
jgi:hypothetical protein